MVASHDSPATKEFHDEITYYPYYGTLALYRVTPTSEPLKMPYLVGNKMRFVPRGADPYLQFDDIKVFGDFENSALFLEPHGLDLVDPVSMVMKKTIKLKVISRGDPVALTFSKSDVPVAIDGKERFRARGLALVVLYKMAGLKAGCFQLAKMSLVEGTTMKNADDGSIITNGDKFRYIPKLKPVGVVDQYILLGRSNNVLVIGNKTVGYHVYTIDNEFLTLPTRTMALERIKEYKAYDIQTLRETEIVEEEVEHYKGPVL